VVVVLLVSLTRFQILSPLVFLVTCVNVCLVG
jgi:hypothetical protein